MFSRIMILATYLASCASFSMDNNTSIVDLRAEPAATMVRMEQEKKNALQKRALFKAQFSYETLKDNFLNALFELQGTTPIPTIYNELKEKVEQDWYRDFKSSDLENLLNFALFERIFRSPNICAGCNETTNKLIMNDLSPIFNNIIFAQDMRLKLCSNCWDFIYSFDDDLDDPIEDMFIDISEVGSEFLNNVSELGTLDRNAQRFAIAVFVAEQVRKNIRNNQYYSSGKWELTKIMTATLGLLYASYFIWKHVIITADK